MSFLAHLVRFSLRRPVLVVVFYLVLAILSAFFVRQTIIDTDIANLLPDSDPHVQTMHTLTETVGGEDRFEVIIRAASLEEMLVGGWAFSHGLEAVAREGMPLITRFKLRKDSDVMRKNLLYFFTNDELDSLETRLLVERASIRQRLNPFFIDFEDDFEEFDEDDGNLNENVNGSKTGGFQETGLDDSDDRGNYFRVGGRSQGGGVADFNELQLPSEYTLNADSTALLITFFPSGSKGNISYVEDLFGSVDSVARATEMAHPGVTILYGGNLKNHLTKFHDINRTLQFSVVFGVSGILLFLMMYILRLAFVYMRSETADGVVNASRQEAGTGRNFSRDGARVTEGSEAADGVVNASQQGAGTGRNFSRDGARVTEGSEAAGRWWPIGWSVASVVVILLPLVSSLLLTYAAAYFLFDSLNIMTTVLVAILLGVNIDYILHFFSTWMQYRSGFGPIRAILLTFYDCGKALIISCFTSGMAMLALMISEFRGFYEFGALFFIGIISTYFITISLFVVLVFALDRVFNRGRVNALRLSKHSVTKPSFFERNVFKFAGGLAVLTIFAVVFVPNIQFEYAFGELEPRSEIVTDFDQTRRTFEAQTRSDPAYFLFETRDQAISAATLIQSDGDSLQKYQTVGHVESLHARFPSTQQEISAKLTRIGEIREILEDDLFGESNHEIIEILRIASAQLEPVSLQEVPDFFKNRFLDRDGELANMVIIYPNMMLADGRASIQFKEDAGTVSVDNRTFYAASTSMIAAGILQIMQRESVWLIVLPLLMSLICLLIFFKSMRWGLLTFAPLLASIILLVGFMSVFGYKFNLYNVIVLPAVLGVGTDNGVHLFHRLREGNFQNFSEVLRSTGVFISAASITTTLGFAGLIFTNHPGLQSMGVVAVLGIFLTLLCAIIFATIVAQWQSRRE